MNLEFLMPTDSGAVARSPMERSAAAEGAKFEIRDGWNIAVGYGASAQQESNAVQNAAVWADASHLGKLELQAPGDVLDGVAGTALPYATAVRADGAWWCRLTRTRVLVVGAVSELRERLSAQDNIDVVDVTTTFAAMTLAGPLAREVFARFSAIDLRPQVTPVAGLRPGSIARQPAVLICEAPDRYLFLFGWATGEYVWSVVADAGFHLGARPIDLDTLAALAPGPQEASRA